MIEIDTLVTPLIGPISLTVPEGTCSVIEGPSGSGKSLLLRAIADLDPNRGEVRLCGRSRAATPAPDWRRRLGFVPANSGWWSDVVRPHFNDPEKALPLIERLDMQADSLDWEVERLSTGETQRLALARAVARDPEALLLDEPTAALDRVATARVEDLIRDLMASGTSIILVSHDPEQVDRLADARFRMEKGRLEERT